ncbi:MAG: AIPR family protein [Desulfocucumaceae bacterium]
MYLNKIEPDDFTSFQAEIEKNRTAVDRTLNLTWFYVNARFKIPEKEFKNIYSVDGSNDGGIDCFFQEGNTFYLIQSKYHERSLRESTTSIKHELQKIEKTLIGENTNNYATDFINALRREVTNSNCYLEIIWLSTNEVVSNTKKDAQEYLDRILKNRKWALNADINFIDRFALEGVIYDIKHGYVPHTGKKELKYEPGECMVIDKGRDNIESIVCNVKAIDLLQWFNNSQEISKYLQKNVRESVGENAINKALRTSFKQDPSLFWYKHNGIIIFADWLEVNVHDRKVTIRNPQIVNGAQTVTQLYKAHDENRNHSNPAKLLVRIYRLPYEDSETYKRSIDIIAALNSQNKIKSSDLHSTDPRQVMIENRINELGLRYTYHRKRTEDGRVSSPYNVFMTKLALFFSICEYKKPDEGISGQIESYFEEEKRYDDAFPENQIKKPLGKYLDHIVFKYIDSWRLYYLLDRTVYYELSNKKQEYYQFIKWYALVDIYNLLQNWKEQVFAGTWREWVEFIDSPEYSNSIVKYSKPRCAKFIDMLPKNEADPRNFYKSTAGRKKFEMHSGSFIKFKQELNKAYEMFKKHNEY